jgi:hypothetical protein
MINDPTYVSQLAGAFYNATGSFGTLTTKYLVVPDITGMTSTGSMYFDQLAGTLKVWNGSAWLSMSHA